MVVFLIQLDEALVLGMEGYVSGIIQFIENIESIKFILMAYLTNTDFNEFIKSAIVNIKPEHINDGMIDITQVKTKERVAIPMTKEVERLLTKYNNSLHKISNQKFNDYLYEIVKK